jgi:acetolactate synthase-1/2/3 large subunit
MSDRRRVPAVADVLADTLARAGARTAFASRGATVAIAGGSPPPSPERALVDALARRGFGVAHAVPAAAACSMAAVAGLLTDAPGVAVLSAGGVGGAMAGAASDVAGALTQAMRDRAPLVAVTDRALVIPLEGAVKASLTVSAEAAAHRSAHACQLALTEPRGPVHLVVESGTAAAPAVPLATAVRPAPLAGPDRAVLDGAADLLARAQRPVLVAGRQCRTAEVATWLRALAESLPAPVVVTVRGKGALPDPHPLHLGLIGARTSPEALLRRADLAVAIGLDAEELPPGALPAALPVLRLAASPWTHPDPPRMEMIGEIASLIEELAPRLRGRARADWDVAEMDRIRRAMALSLAAPHSSLAVAVRIAREATPAGTIGVVAAGEVAEAVAPLWPVVGPGELLVLAAPRRPGLVLAAALAAGLARPQARAIGFASAGELGQAEAELDLAVRLAVPVLIVLVGVSRGAPAGAPRDIGTPTGWTMARADDPATMSLAIERALASAGPAMVDART